MSEIINIEQSIVVKKILVLDKFSNFFKFPLNSPTIDCNKSLLKHYQSHNHPIFLITLYLIFA